VGIDIVQVDMVPFWFWAIFVVLFGLVIGSFLNVVIYRVPLEKSIVTPRSSCPDCGHQITAIENIPVLSYLFLRGRCRGCRARISPVYPFVEALTATGFLLAFWKQASMPEFNLLYFIADAAFISAAIALIFIDYSHYILPNSITLPGTLLALIVRIFVPNLTSAEPTFYALQLAIIILLVSGLFILLGKLERSNLFNLSVLAFLVALMLVACRLSDNFIDWYITQQTNFFILWNEKLAMHPVAITLLNSLLGMIIGAGVLVMLREAYFVLRKKEGMGLGDVKMMLMVGAFLGWQLALGTLVLASFLGTIAALALFPLRGRDTLQSKIPFGIFLGSAAIILVLFGNEILDWYVQHFIVR
jgi:leader peptidase (prepilin peptidase) / N-methyltransferase